MSCKSSLLVRVTKSCQGRPEEYVHAGHNHTNTYARHNHMNMYAGHNHTDMGHQATWQKPGCAEWADGGCEVAALQL